MALCPSGRGQAGWALGKLTRGLGTLLESASAQGEATGRDKDSEEMGEVAGREARVTVTALFR